MVEWDGREGKEEREEDILNFSLLPPFVFLSVGNTDCMCDLWTPGYGSIDTLSDLCLAFKSFSLCVL